MSYNRQRRIRGTGKSTVALNVHIDPSAKAKIDKVADALGRSQGQVLDLIVGHADIELDATDEYRGKHAQRSDGMSTVGVMNTTQVRQRRTRGTGKSTVALNVHIDPEAKAKIDRAADTFGQSQGQVLDFILNNTRVDGHGRPAFWDGPLATDLQRELPLASSA